MCGIIGIVNQKKSSVPNFLIQGLKTLEYRGYDSAGIALNSGTASNDIYKEHGKVSNLEQALGATNESYFSGIGHTRWATHGKPKRDNSHPFQCADITILCNGILENYSELRDFLNTQKNQLTSDNKAEIEYTSDTDTEVLGFLLNHHFADCGDITQAISRTLEQSTGSYALLVMIPNDTSIYACMNGCPLVVGTSKSSSYIASDALALSKSCSEYLSLQQGDIVRLDAGSISWLRTHDGTMLGETANQRERYRCSEILAETEKGNYRHFFQKESFEIPDVINRCLDGMIAQDNSHIIASGFGQISAHLDDVEEIHLVGCGSSNYSAMMGAYWIAHLAGIPAHCYVASEYVVNTPPVNQNTLWIGISQSGETADTLSALAIAKASGKYLTTLAVVNVVGSMMQREADHTVLTKAGREICVLSTKTNSAQATTMLMLALELAQRNGMRSDQLKSIITGLREVAEGINTVLNDRQYQELAPKLVHEKTSSMFFLGRGIQFVVASEGALKMMEGAYLHAQAYAGGELKHGPLAFMHEGVPVIGLLPNDNAVILRKMLSSLEEVEARGANVFIICSKSTSSQLKGTKADHWQKLLIPDLHPEVAYLAEVVAVQQLAYAVAIQRGTDIDQPRNLAKSVTVE